MRTCPYVFFFPATKTEGVGEVVQGRRHLPCTTTQIRSLRNRQECHGHENLPADRAHRELSGGGFRFSVRRSSREKGSPTPLSPNLTKKLHATTHETVRTKNRPHKTQQITQQGNKKHTTRCAILQKSRLSKRHRASLSVTRAIRVSVTTG